jgi:mycothiol synthase
MFREPRVYQGDNDLAAMRDLLRQGRLANNGSYYVHPGDLNWWLFYPPLEYDFWQSIFLWDDPDQPGQILAWVLLSPVGSTFDVVLRPELHGSALAWEMYGWAIRRLTVLAKNARREQIGVYWIAEEDVQMRGWLVEHGFALASRDAHLTCELAAARPGASLADGYEVRSSRGLAEVSQRAKAQYGAFSGSVDFERYVQRFARFMAAPVYDPELDVVAVAPDGQIGAFCIAWPDPLTGVGLFEPVGTHPDFQRKGLGKAVMLAALDRLQRKGMRQAIVTTGEDNQPAIKLYESVGFHLTSRLLYYKLKIN